MQPNMQKCKNSAHTTWIQAWMCMCYALPLISYVWTSNLFIQLVGVGTCTCTFAAICRYSRLYTIKSCMHVLLLLYKKKFSVELSCTVLCIAYFKWYLFVWVVLFTPTLSSKTSIVDRTTGISGCLLTNGNNNSTSKSLFCFHFVFVRIEPNHTHRWCCVLREENIKKSVSKHIDGAYIPTLV